jgi:hypothetical protein
MFSSSTFHPRAAKKEADRARSMTTPFAIVLLCLVLAPFAVAAEPKVNLVLSPVEQTVIDQLRNNGMATLTEYAEDATREISPQFLEHLLTNTLEGFTPPPTGIRISGAIVTDSVLVSSDITSDVFLNRIEFRGHLYLTDCQILGNLHFNSCKFPLQAVFANLKVRRELRISFSTFEFQATFDSVEANTDFVVEHCEFHSKDQTAWFGNLKVGNDAIFLHDEFSGPAVFTGAEIGGTLSLTHTKFISDIPARLDMIRVKDGKFDLLKTKGGLDLFGSEFDKLDLSLLEYQKTSTFDLRATKYRLIKADEDDRKSHTILMQVLSQSKYSADVYQGLEAYFTRVGDRISADKVFLDGRRRERREYLTGLGKVGNYVVDKLCEYGRDTARVGYICVGFIALGAVIFSSRKMEPVKLEDAKRVYNPFWYSLGLFLPFVDLQADKIWKPRNKHRFLRHYMRIHILLGWILIPIVLAALSGLIK